MFDSPPVQFNNITHHMLLWDVGLNGMLLMESEALADMAHELGRTDDELEILQRHDELLANFNSQLWDSTSQCFVNKIPGQSFYKRISPTSFYGMIGKAATNDQAIQLVTNYLASKDHFCVSAACPYSMPSISRSDPAFYGIDSFFLKMEVF